MNLATLLTSYLSLNFLIAVAVLALAAARRFKISAVQELKLHYFGLSLVALFCATQPLLPKNEIFTPAAKVWSTESSRSFKEQYKSAEQSGYLKVTNFKSVEADHVLQISFVLLAAVILGAGLLMSRDLRILFRIRREAFAIRQIGRVRILVSEAVQVPFSYWLPKQANVVLPAWMVSHPRDMKIAIAHELQHHRQKDTRWIFALWGLKMLCAVNPAIHLWSRWISEVQEFACDETLVDQNKVESQAYARCLVEVAQTALNQNCVPVCATGLTLLVERNILKRRIEKMFSKKQTTGRSIRYALGLAMVALMATTVYAAKSLVQDRRVSMSQALEMRKKAQSQSGFPVVVNDLVLKELNRFIGTPEGRAYMRDSLQRLENYRALVEQKIHQYGLPEELMAVPIIESGYQNLPENNKEGWGAGLWMFIKSTAHKFGLKVDTPDERLNVAMLTDAAMRYFTANFARFQDWQLATLAYNVGEANVQEGIDKVGSRDAWVLIRKGYENDHDYLPRLMAAILVMRNPDSVQ